MTRPCHPARGRRRTATEPPGRTGTRAAVRLGAVLTATFGAALGLAVPASAAPPLQTCQPAEIRATEGHWRFGNGAALDFGVSGNATPTAAATGHNSVEGTTVVTDTAGNLLFWSNGQQAFDRNDDPMPTGSGLLGNPSATQTVAAFPSLGNPGQFFVVTTSSDVGAGTLTYSVVDMAENGGLGDIDSTRKNIQLGIAGTASEAITAVPNHDGTGYWVLTYTQGSPDILAYEFDADGPVTGDAVVSTMPTSHGSGYGSISVSPDLSRLVLIADGGSANSPARMRMLEIDAETGVVSQTAEWDTATSGQRGYYADFSPSGDYVYATRIFGTGSLYRYDVSAPSNGASIKGSETLIGTLGANGGAVRRGPDGRMYAARRTISDLATVSVPDAADPADVDFDVAGLALDASSANGWGLPQTVTGCPRSVTGTKTVSNLTDPTPGAPVQPGDELEYTVTYQNHVTGTPAGDLVISDPIPAGTTYVPGSLEQVTGAPSTGTRTDAVGDDTAEYVSGTDRVVFRAGAGADPDDGGTLGAGDEAQVRFRVRVAAEVPTGSVSNVATATYSTLPGVEIEEATPPVSRAFDPVSDLRLGKAITAGTPTAGTDLTYRFTVTNDGASPSPSATVTDTLPVGMTFVSGDPGCSAAGQDVTCTVGALDDGESATRDIVVALAMNLDGPVENAAAVTGPNTDPDPGNSTGKVTVTVVPPAPPTVKITGPDPQVPVGGKITAGFTCTGAATPLTCGATVKRPDGTVVPIKDGDPLPTDVPGVYTITVTSVDDLGRVTTETRTYEVFGPPLVRIDGPAPGTALTVGEPSTGRFVCGAPAGIAECVATVTRPDGSVVTLRDGDPLPSDLVGEYTVTVALTDRLGRTTVETRSYVVNAAPVVDDAPDSGRLKITKRFTRSSLRPGQRTTLRIRVTNGTGRTLRNVKVCERIPAGLRLVSSTPRAKRTGGRYCWTIRTLRPGKYVNRSMVLRATNRPGRVRSQTRGTASGVRAATRNASVRVLAPRKTRPGGVTG